MASGRVRVICGAGNGKSASALGYAMMGVFRGKRVIMVQFLKGMIGEEAADVSDTGLPPFSSLRDHVP